MNKLFAALWSRAWRMLTEAWTHHKERQIERAADQVGARKSRPAPRTADLSGVLIDIRLR